MSSLDAYDRRLLELVQRDGSLSRSELGERVHLSTAAVNRRLERLRDEGVIRRYCAVSDASSVDNPLTIVAQVETQSEQVELLDAMKATFLACPPAM